jgi:hypothetical protein
MAKKAEEVKEEIVETTEETKLEYRTVKDKNFVGFVHPDTRKLITVNEKGRLFVDKTDKKAIAILNAAQDVFLLED